MNCRVWRLISIASLLAVVVVRAETESIDLKALAKTARPAVMLLVVSDANGKEIATGTGFLVSNDGKLITNHHVIEGAASAVAKAENGGLFPVEGVLADDPKNDLVLLKLEGKDLPFLTISTNETVEVGTRIAVIGSPLGLEGTLSEGIVSAVRELMGDVKMLQVTAAISLGSSGSPVLNAKCEAVGVATSLLKGGQALNFAVPSEIARKLLQASATVAAKPLTSFRVTSNDPDSEVYQSSEYREAYAAEASEDWVALLKASQALVRKFPDFWRAYVFLSSAYIHLNFFDDAVAAQRQAIKLKPDNAYLWLSLGSAYVLQGKHDEAIAAFRQGIKLTPDDAVAWGALGDVYIKQHKYDDAIAALQQAIKLKPPEDATFARATLAHSWSRMGDAYHLQGKYEDAITAYRQAIKIEPDDANTWWSLGGGYFIQREYDDAAAAYRQAINIKPDFPLAWDGLGAAYVLQRKIEDAITAYRQAIKLKPDDANAWYGLGDCYQISGRTAESQDAFQRARELKPE